MVGAIHQKSVAGASAVERRGTQPSACLSCQDGSYYPTPVNDTNPLVSTVKWYFYGRQRGWCERMWEEWDVEITRRNKEMFSCLCIERLAPWDMMDELWVYGDKSWTDGSAAHQSQRSSSCLHTDPRGTSSGKQVNYIKIGKYRYDQLSFVLGLFHLYWGTWTPWLKICMILINSAYFKCMSLRHHLKMLDRHIRQHILAQDLWWWCQKGAFTERADRKQKIKDLTFN